MDSMMAHRLTAEGYEREKEKENNCYRDTKTIEEKRKKQNGRGGDRREENRTGEKRKQEETNFQTKSKSQDKYSISTVTFIALTETNIPSIDRNKHS